MVRLSPTALEKEEAQNAKNGKPRIPKAKASQKRKDEKWNSSEVAAFKVL